MRALGATEPFPKWCFYVPQQCVVEIISIGHYPDTAIIKLPDGEQTECYLRDLKDREELDYPRA